jgi:hypothetical protein
MRHAGRELKEGGEHHLKVVGRNCPRKRSTAAGERRSTMLNTPRRDETSQPWLLRKPVLMRVIVEAGRSQVLAGGT